MRYSKIYQVWRFGAFRSIFPATFIEWEKGRDGIYLKIGSVTLFYDLRRRQ